MPLMLLGGLKTAEYVTFECDRFTKEGKKGCALEVVFSYRAAVDNLFPTKRQMSFVRLNQEPPDVAEKP